MGACAIDGHGLAESSVSRAVKRAPGTRICTIAASVTRDGLPQIDIEEAVQGASERGAVGAFGSLKPTLADERLDFAVAQLNCHADELGRASMASVALTCGGQLARQDARSSLLFQPRDRGEVVGHFLQSKPSQTCLRDPKTGEFSFAYCTIQTVSARHCERMVAWWRETSLSCLRSVVSVMSVIFLPAPFSFFCLPKCRLSPGRTQAREGAKKGKVGKITDITNVTDVQQ